MKHINFKSWRTRALILVIGLTLLASMAGISLKASAAGTGPCDIYASGGTPCVAAHSTVRALYGAYSGNLYQVRRASDNTTKDIPVLTAGGYVNISVQDSFCSGTTCTISILYDQSSQHNDLRKAPAGATWLPNGGNESSATKGMATVAGHTVYGIYVTGFSDNVAYRVTNTTGVAKASQAESMYMVVDGRRYSKDCCFDYGNAETNGKDNGNGTMEAIYFGTDTAWGGQGDGNGPWIAADLENGMFKGNAGCYNCYPGPFPSAKSLAYNFVSAFLKGPDANTFTLKGGNAQSGALTTMWNSSRPSPNYYPKKLEGAIILGTGGDGSNGGTGTFYEGAMTIGNPSDAIDDAIQANIIAAGYGSNNPGPTNTPGPSPTPTNTPLPNLAQGKTASADSSQTANPAANGNDGNTSTRWCANDANANHWWKVDLGASYALTGSQVMWEFAKNYKYKVEVSTDNTTWTMASDKTASTNAAQTQTDSFSVTARYVRITVTTLPDTNTWASFFEFRVFGGGTGPTNTPVPPTKTNTPVGPTPTKTNTPVGPTPTKTNTPTTGPSPTGTSSLTPTRTPTAAGPTATPGSTCSPVTATITAPFTQDGAGTFCWQSSNLGAYVNSWNLTSLTINGVNETNLYVASGSYPAKINGYWYISYTGTVAWGHFEAK
jgi:hypothetical protein